VHGNVVVMCGLHDSVLKFCSTNKINALRIPISLALALNPEQRVAAAKCAECPPGAKSWDMLDKLFDKAAAVGILIVLDMHRMDPVSAHTNVLYT
jgi:aryl-phospho-beta-D-glucosidase BglC (GH1 family)